MGTAREAAGSSPNNGYPSAARNDRSGRDKPGAGQAHRWHSDNPRCKTTGHDGYSHHAAGKWATRQQPATV